MFMLPPCSSYTIFLATRPVSNAALLMMLLFVATAAYPSSPRPMMQAAGQGSWMIARHHSINKPETTANSNLQQQKQHDYYSYRSSLNAASAGAQSISFEPSKLNESEGRGECTERDIGIWQSREATAGVPEFVVQIYSTCVSVDGCEPSDVHVRCQWFASKVVVNPSLFRRLAFDDCLVNAGRPLPTGHILHFTYQNTFMYALSFKSAKFC